MKTSTLFINVTILICLLVANGFGSSFKWRAEDYFGDPKVISLCKAIEAEDLDEIDRLVTDGVDVNVRGKGNVTPLLWAFLRENSEAFKRLLEYGADPNVELTSDFSTTQKGDSVLHLAARTKHPNYFKYVMQHGGDPNLIRGNKWKKSPLMTVIDGACPDKKEAIQLLIDAGADLEYRSCEMSSSALSHAATGGERYSLALQILKAGASFNLCKENGGTPLHAILREEKHLSERSEQQKKDYAELLEILKNKGADIEGAKKDIAIWAQGGKLSQTRIEELKKRYADELAAKQAAKEQKEQEEKENDALP